MTKKKKFESVIDFSARDEFYEIPKEVSVTETIIYDWVVEHFGESEAEDPSWNIHALAEAIDENWNENYKQKYPVRYLKQ